MKYGYLMEVNGEKIFVIAMSIAGAFEKAKVKGGSVVLLSHSSIEIIN